MVGRGVSHRLGGMDGGHRTLTVSVIRPYEQNKRSNQLEEIKLIYAKYQYSTPGRSLAHYDLPPSLLMLSCVRG